MALNSVRWGPSLRRSSGRGPQGRPPLRPRRGRGLSPPDRIRLELTTENSVGIIQRVLPTFTTVVGQGGGARASLGEYDPAMLVHGEQAIQLLGELPIAGTVSVPRRWPACSTRGRPASSCLRVSHAMPGRGELAFTNRTALLHPRRRRFRRSTQSRGRRGECAGRRAAVYPESQTRW